MGLFSPKQEIYLGGFVRLLLKEMISSKSLDIATINEGSLLSEKEVEKANEEILPLRLTLLSLLLNKIGKFGKQDFSSEEIGKTIGVALGLAYQDSGSSKSVASELAGRALDRIGNYYDNLMKVDEKEVEGEGPYFFVVNQYPNLILGKKLDPMNEKNREKRFVLFDAAKQVYRNDEKNLPKLIDQFKFLD